ncbi:MAG: DUF4038 domain-containing protein, partial [Eubacteriales bacterium]|nr:DUF4038 domain-containing protein [Eubacteriales bacterium]
MKKLALHESSRYLCYEDGSPFFYLADTAWDLFHRLNKEDAEEYFTAREKQGFNAIQAVILSEHEGITTPNAYGQYVFRKNSSDNYDPTLFDEDGDYSYWDHIDYVIDLAKSHNLYMVILPTWGDKFNQRWGKGPEVFTPENAYEYGKLLGKRFGNRDNIIWMLGGDRPLESPIHQSIIDEMARGIKEGEGTNTHLMTFHPVGRCSSIDYVKHKNYIDFHTCQSGHSDGWFNSYKMLRRTGDGELKPFMDSEPRYEDHPAYFDVKTKHYWSDADVRQNTYMNLMEGACGNTYGNHNIWCFNDKPSDYFPFNWKDVLYHPGANQAQFAKKLRLSRPYYDFRYAPELVENDDETSVLGHIAAG